MNFPAGFLESLSGAPGFDRDQFNAAHEKPAEISVRLNPLKPVHSFDTADPVLWCDQAYYLKSRPEFIFDPLLHAGCYYVQEASSMFLHHAVKNACGDLKGKIILDLCAAPGGKTTLLSSLAGTDNLVVSNEVIRTRASILKENVVKWNSLNTIVTSNDPRDFSRLENFFDVIVVDAPCSGSGLFRKDPAAMTEWSKDQVMHCQSRQERILADVLPSLKSGGTLIYSTCSYSVEENERIVNWLIDEYGFEPVNIDVPDVWGIEKSAIQHNGTSFRFYPGKVRGEGLFLTVLRKAGEYTGETQVKARKKKDTGKTKEIGAGFIQEDTHQFEQLIVNDEVIIQPKEFSDIIQFIREKLHVISAGLFAGNMIRTDFIPAHDLALSALLSDEAERIELDHAQAVNYLRRGEITLKEPGKGWKIVTFKHVPLGWVKALGNRVNNYYPKEYRILKEFRG